MDIWFATGNSGKFREAERLLADPSVVVRSLKDVPNYSSPAENGKTFEDNARIKAKALRSIKNKDWIVGDDSGIVVVGLDGLPGVHSARYAGPNARDVENTTKIIKMLHLRRVVDRSAKFVCCLVAISPTGEEFVFHGELNGSIAKKMAGTGGFGYDPIFIPENFEKTFGELSPMEKNKISHRSKAFREFKAVLLKTR
jgi:XTP/dITP diphosphohydrolase